MNREQAKGALGLLAGLALLAGCFFLDKKEQAREPMVRSDFLLNTFVTISVYDSDDETLLDGAMDLCREYENRFSKTIEGSEIYQLNHRSPEETVFSLSSDTASLIEEGLFYSRLSDGGYDLTVEPLSSLWDFTSGQNVIPPKEDIETAAAKVGYENLALEGNTLTFLSPDTTLDLGSIAKGFIADRLKEYLVSQGVESAIINLGGNVLCIGSQPDGEPFRIGIQKPFASHNETVGFVEIDDASVVSSGVYERCFTADGKNYHHLLDPRTGYPYDNGLISVVIICPESVDGDALSTTCFSLGLEKGMELLDSTEDAAGIFITEDYELHFSEGAAELSIYDEDGKPLKNLNEVTDYES